MKTEEAMYALEGMAASASSLGLHKLWSKLEGYAQELRSVGQELEKQKDSMVEVAKKYTIAGINEDINKVLAEVTCGRDQLKHRLESLCSSIKGFAKLAHFWGANDLEVFCTTGFSEKLVEVADMIQAGMSAGLPDKGGP